MEQKYGEREEEEEDNEEGEACARIWNINVTSMEQRGGFLIGQEADVISCEERKMKYRMIGWIREEFRKAG